MNNYMKIAKDLADNNLVTKDGGPFGACIVKDGVIIGKGSNKVLLNNDPTAHAEVMAIRDACKNINSYDLKGCEIYTTCYPCPMCFSAIMWANIDKIYYGNTKEDAENIGFRDKFIYDTIDKISKGESVDLILKSIDREETIKTFNEYNDIDNKEIY